MSHYSIKTKALFRVLLEMMESAEVAALQVWRWTFGCSVDVDVDVAVEPCPCVAGGGGAKSSCSNKLKRNTRSVVSGDASFGSQNGEAKPTGHHSSLIITHHHS